MNMGQRLRELRLKREISQEQVARHIGITRSAYSHYEINNRQPVYETLIKLADYFNVSLDFIIGGSASMKGEADRVAADSREILDLFEHMDENLRTKSITLLTDLIRHEKDKTDVN